MFIIQEKNRKIFKKNATDSVPLKSRSAKMYICANMTIAPNGAILVEI